ncbi:MAG: hypothetical protein EBV29_04800 [Gammaproteobacteria bacterium]|nr:hypothetical protein [Gammaproteobacteria bacterium]
MMQLSQPTVETWRASIEGALATFGRNASPDSPKLQEAATYVLQSGGKRLRGLLTLAVHHDLTGGHGAPESALRPAVAIEVIHAASLIHDDLPALDNDDMRRGKPSCHKAFGEATAILTGDLLVGAAIGSLEHRETALDKQARLGILLANTWRDLCVGRSRRVRPPG